MTSDRTADHAIEPMFLERWSARAFDETAVPEAELMRMFEAARWAPSANNSQSWRFSYAIRDDAHWEQFKTFVMDGNREWADRAGAIVVVLSKTTSLSSSGEERPVRSHAFDTGAATLSFQLQANALGYIAHPIGGIHPDRIRDGLGVPDGYEIHAALIVGRLAPAETLPEKFRAREIKSGRQVLSAFVGKGVFQP